MMTDKNKFHKLYLVYTEAYPNKSKQNCQNEANIIWKSIKDKEKDHDEEMARLKIRAQEKQVSLLKFWSNPSTSASKIDKYGSSSSTVAQAGEISEPSGACEERSARGDRQQQAPAASAVGLYVI